MTENGVMCHPSDAEAWKHFDDTHPDFATEPRNVRLGLCADGFAPHGQYGKSYSSWPVIITPYNLPSWMCMKPEYMFLSLIIPGPANPKRLIDVYLQPLIQELVQLWQGHYTWNPTDASQIRSIFNFRVGKWIREAMGRCRRGNKKADWMSNEVWAGLQSVWASEKFHNISHKINRQRMLHLLLPSIEEGLLGRPPSLNEELEKCWKTKQGNWAGPRAEEAVEKFKKLNDDVISQHLPESSSSTSVNDHQLWLEAIGGVKKGRIWGMGSETKLSTSRTLTTTNTVNPMPEQGESELVQKLLLENKTMRREIKHTQKEMQMLKMQFANKFYGAGRRK
ncbi:UNVERIFIED_CONTAM: hypothetical protein Sangu_3007200 [Sesamum angustifolium]|uniref:Transposase n=1 Tax=Sesamum angustifolium TaxID=2727405 RepID=A0AAW2KNA7_9LAMI